MKTTGVKKNQGNKENSRKKKMCFHIGRGGTANKKRTENVLQGTIPEWEVG